MVDTEAMQHDDCIRSSLRHIVYHQNTAAFGDIIDSEDHFFSDGTGNNDQFLWIADVVF